MLWQPSLPSRYLSAAPDALAAEIRARRAELADSLVILGHHYQTDEVLAHADFTGDSLKLSQIAAKVAHDRPIKHVIFCGVHFMAESADMLTPEHVHVILPDLSAGCSMADMAQHDDTLLAWKTLHEALAGMGWRGRIVPITYVNSSAAIKAFVGEHGGACCTSSNAKQVFAWAMAGGTQPRLPSEHIKVLFLPDQHLGRNTAAAFGIDTESATCVFDPKLFRQGHDLGGPTPAQLLSSDVILWAGHCSVHKLFRPEHCDAVRADDAPRLAADPSSTRTTILVHPECIKEVVDKSDLNGSTEFIITTIRAAAAGTRWRVGTEVHLVTRLAREAAARGVEVKILSDCQCLCTTMYRIDQPHLLWVLDHLTGRIAKDGKALAPGAPPLPPRVVNAIQVHPDVRAKALLALERMLSLTGHAPKFEAGVMHAVD